MPIGFNSVIPGSINELAVAYYASSAWQLLRPTTQATYRGEIERFRRDHGDKSFLKIRSVHIRKMLDVKAMQPNAANNRLRVIRILFSFAQEREMRPDNPAREVRKLKVTSDGYHVWTEPEIAKFESFWRVGSRERLAFDLLLYTGQRSADVRVMTKAQIANAAIDKGGNRRRFISVCQEKTKVSLEIPVHSALVKSLAAAKSGELLLLPTAQGRPFSAKGFSNWISAAAKDAGLEGCTAHGLRKSAATRLADAGCSAHQIMAVTGHKTLSEVQRYTRSAEQRVNAGVAMRHLEETDRERKLSNRKPG